MSSGEITGAGAPSPYEFTLDNGSLILPGTTLTELEVYVTQLIDRGRYYDDVPNSKQDYLTALEGILRQVKITRSKATTVG